MRRRSFRFPCRTRSLRFLFDPFDPRFRDSSCVTLDIPEVGTDTTVFDVSRIITSVHVINDVADIYGEGSKVARIEYPQAIAFGTDAGIITLDKEVWFF